MKTALATLSLLVAISLTTANQCQWGPSYWCQSRDTALSCGQMRYCQENMWKTQSQVKQPESIIDCTVCKLIVEYANKYIDKSATEKQAEGMVDTFCGGLVAFESECKALVGAYFPRVWQLLQTETDPNTVCAELGLCSSVELKAAEPESGIECTVCKMVVEFADQYIDSNATEQEAEAIIEKFCSITGAFESECKSLIEQYFPLLWKLLQSETDPDKVCALLGLCSSVGLKAAEPESGIECTVCKMVVEFADQYIDSNATEEEAEAIIEKFCSITGAFESECKSLIEQYFPLLWKLLQSETDPDKVCALLGLCSSVGLKVKEPESIIECTVCKLIVEFADKYIDSNDTEKEAEGIIEKFCSDLGGLASECKSLVEKYFPELWKFLQSQTDPDKVCAELGLCSSVGLKVTKPKIDGCDICKIIVDIADKFIDSNKTEELVEDEVKKVCAFLPGVATECEALVEEFFPVIWRLLETEADPDTICGLIGLCSNTSPKVARLSSKTAVARPDSVSCQACTMVVMVLKEFINNNKTENVAKEEIEKFCGVLGPFGNECKELVEDYFDMIWKLLMNELSPSEVCSQLGFCKSVKLTATQTQGEYCDICKDICEFLQIYVDNNATEEEVKEVLELFCSMVPAFSSQCKEFLADFDSFWKKLQGIVDGESICYQLGICASSSEVHVQMEIQKPRAMSPQQDICTYCKLIVNFLVPYIDDNATEEEVEDVLEELCGLLPSSLKVECDSFVDEYFKLVWALVKSEFDNDQICYQLNLCTSVQVAKVKTYVLKVDPVCSLCKLVVSFLRPFVNSNSTEGDVKAALTELCKILPSTYKTECNQLLENFNVLWKLLQEEVDDGQLCALVHLCNNSISIPHMPVVAMTTPNVESPETILCTLCELVMEKIESLLVNNATETEIIEVVEKICDFFPSAERSYCDKFIAEYGKLIIKALVDGVGPKVVCTLIHLCLGEEAKIEAFSFDMKIGECSVCEFVLEMVKDAVGENFTKSAVVDALDHVCGLFPSALRDECKTFVNEYGSDVVQLLDDAIDPKAICETIKLCPKTSRLAAPWQMLEKIPPY